jgi:iron complex transport system substrate-binding protein
MARALFLGCALFLLAGVPGCGDAPEQDEPAFGASRQVEAAGAFPRTIVDDEGRSVTFQAPPRTVLSLVPSTTEVLRALGLQDRLVGRTDFDADPALAHLPSVGGGLEPSPERLISLSPELVIRFAAESDRATPAHLDRAGIPHLAFRPDRIEDIRRTIRILGRVTDRVSEADSLIRALDRGLAEVEGSVAGAPRPRVAFLLGGDPPWLVGPGTFLHEILALAGGENVFGDLENQYAPVSVEELVRRRPELLVTFPNARIPRGLEGVPVRRVPAELQTPGYQVAASARTLARALHPDRFP